MRTEGSSWSGGWRDVVDDDSFLGGAEAVGEGVFGVEGKGGAGDGAKKGEVPEDGCGFGVDVDEPELAGVMAERALQAMEDLPEGGGEEGVVEVEEDGGQGEVDGGGVGVERLEGPA